MITPMPLNIMLIEDRTVQAIDLETKLEDLGHTVVAVAGHIGRAMEMLETAEGRIDAVLMHPHLAGRSARPVAERLFRLGVPYGLLTEREPAELRRLGLRGPRLVLPAAPSAIESALRQIMATIPPRVSLGAGVASIALAS